MHYLNRRLPGLLPYFPTWKMLEMYYRRLRAFLPYLQPWKGIYLILRSGVFTVKFFILKLEYFLESY